MFYLYLLISIASVLVADRTVGLFREPYGWWATPVILISVFLILIILHIIVLLISVWTIDMNKPVKKISRYWRGLVAVTLPSAFKLGRVHIHTSGEEKIPENGRFMLVCNHTHDFDPAVIISELPKAELGFIGKKEICDELPLVAKIMHKLNCLFIDRENNRNAAKTIVEAVRLIKDDVVSIGVFPEGYTSLDGELHHFRNGVFKIAYKANVPIVVCTLHGVKSIVKNMFRRRTDVYLDVLETISPEEFAEENTSQLGERIFTLMSENIEKRKQ